MKRKRTKWKGRGRKRKTEEGMGGNVKEGKEKVCKNKLVVCSVPNFNSVYILLPIPGKTAKIPLS